MLTERRKEAEKIIEEYTVLAVGGGLVPAPLLDLVAVTVIQIEMLNKIGDLYGIRHSRVVTKNFITGLTGSSIARFGASFVKAIPGYGFALGGFSMGLMSGASTYAVGKVVLCAFERDESLDDVDMERAKQQYNESYPEGKEAASRSKRKREQSPREDDIFMSIEKLSDLRDKGALSEEEFTEHKQRLLAQL